ncbi:MAG: CsbD family protein [Proteobacteria bacterium]|nr:CsbD family protein [Pseudomonadota bacterium]
MKSSTKDNAKGKMHQAKGKLKETVGKIINNGKLEAEGIAEKIGGKAQEKIGQIKKFSGN